MTSNKLDRSAVWRVFAILRRFTLKLQNPLKFSLMLYLNLFTILLDDMLCLIKLFFWQHGDHLLPPTEMVMENLIDNSCLSFFHLLIDIWMLHRITASIEIFCYFSCGSIFTGISLQLNYNSSISVSMNMLWCRIYLFFFHSWCFLCCCSPRLGKYYCSKLPSLIERHLWVL